MTGRSYARSAPREHQSGPAADPRRRWAVVMLLAATALAAVAGLAAAQPRDGGLVVAASVRSHPLLMGFTALALLAGSVRLGVRTRRLRLGLLVPLGGLGLVLMLSAPLVLLVVGDVEETARVPAPGRGDRRLVVEEGSAAIDPLWYVYVHQGGGLTERRWRVGFFNGDAMGNELADASWETADRVRMVTGDGAVHVVRIAPNGRPERFVSVP
ncbi:hypothetical protein [Streptomyces sp. NPDC089799]|uniref:hypothetical protein n=1 Tax=Streptomyces sp. NPDC089799 TaxID=3155066 RepID=UPI0034294543